MPHQTEEHPRYEMAVSVHGVTLGYAGREDRLTGNPPGHRLRQRALTRPPEEPPCLS